jgi:hypothetical protein
MTRLTKYRQRARNLRLMRRELVHDAGCVVCRRVACGELYIEYIKAAVRRGVRIPRSLRAEVKP